MDRAEIMCQMRCQITAAVSHSLHTIKKLTLYTTQGDVGSQSDCCAERGVPATTIDLGIIMDPVAFLLLFNITIWLYWTVK